MIRTFEAIVDEKGNDHLLEPVHLPGMRRALVTVLEEAPDSIPGESAMLSEKALEDWNRPEEDVAWSYSPFKS